MTSIPLSSKFLLDFPNRTVRLSSSLVLPPDCRPCLDNLTSVIGFSNASEDSKEMTELAGDNTRGEICVYRGFFFDVELRNAEVLPRNMGWMVLRGWSHEGKTEYGRIIVVDSFEVGD